MPELRLTGKSYMAAPELDRLRIRAQDLGNAEDWAALHALAPELARDTEFWPDLYGPLCALAARRLGQPGALDQLAELVRAGFCQPELFEGQLEAAFDSDPGWPQVAAQMARKVPPPVLLTDWPVLVPAAPLALFDLPDRTAELRGLLPAPAESGWQTAVATLGWVTHRWKHGNAHIEVNDAVECLRRVDAGQRFACVEYSLVLCHALNALGIPSRRLELFQQGYHAGLARGHVVSEAWIDDKCRWVVLDGQNGLYWTGPDGEPLGAPELNRVHRAGASRPGYQTSRDEFSDTDADLWFSYFAHVTSTAGSWAPDGFNLVFQRNRLAQSGRLEHQPETLYPDLSGIGVQTGLDGDRPALRLTAAHPYASGFSADGQPLNGDVLALDLAPGEHRLELAVRTSYGELPGHPLRYQAAPPVG